MTTLAEQLIRANTQLDRVEGKITTGARKQLHQELFELRQLLRGYINQIQGAINTNNVMDSNLDEVTDKIDRFLQR